MAEFRKLFYALGLAAMLAGVSSTASAQTTICNSNAGVPPIIRTESFADLVGDYVLDCTGGASTARGQIVPVVNVTVTLSTNITSKILSTLQSTAGSAAGPWSEALLLMDEPNSASRPAIPLLACGDAGAGDNDPVLGRGRCNIVSTGNYLETYDGAPNATVINPGAGVNEYIVCSGLTPNTDPDGTGPLRARPTAGSLGCGHPNVYQGRLGLAQNAGNTNIIVFNGVPFDPPGVDTDNPGLVRHRYLRITNIRANAPPVASGFLLQTVVMNVNINGSALVAINNPTQTVASVQIGIQGPVVNSNVNGAVISYIQCVANTPSTQPQVRFREGFASSFKPQSVGGTVENGTYDGTAIRYTPGSVVGYENSFPLRQNVTGANYNTESGFMSPPSSLGYSNPSPNPPLGIGSIATSGGTSIDNATNIELAGIATQGTRIAVTFRDLPAGLTISIPPVIPLVPTGVTLPTGFIFNAVNCLNLCSGVAARTDTASLRGDGGFDFYDGDNTLTGDQVVYEILFSDPATVEDLTIPVTVTYNTNNIASNLPEVNKTAQVAGGFAPYILSTDSANAWGQAQQASATVQTVFFTNFLPVPRFRTQSSFQDIFRVVKCSCNLLFPFVSNAASSNGNYDTGIAIANTSLTPGAAAFASQRFGFAGGTSQEGPVQFWYYPANSTDPPVATQCTNTTATGVCPGTKAVKAGETLLYVLSQGSSQWGLKAAPGFTGYMIAQANFQYCHAFAYISPQGATPLTNGMSVGYLALILDKQLTSDTTAASTLPSRTSSAGEALTH